MFIVEEQYSSMNFFFAKLITTLFTPHGQYFQYLRHLQPLYNLLTLLTRQVLQYLHYLQLHQLKYSSSTYNVCLYSTIQDMSIVTHKNTSCTHTQVMASHQILITVITMAASMTNFYIFFLN